MPTYELKFEFFGKKMKTKVEAKNAEDAKNKVLNRIHIESIKMKNAVKGDDFLDFVNYFHNLK